MLTPCKNQPTFDKVIKLWKKTWRLITFYGQHCSGTNDRTLLQLCSVSCLFNGFRVVVVVAQSGASDHNETDHTYCPVGQSGYFPDPTNCSLYVHCGGPLTSFHQCPAGQHWRVTGHGYGYCDHPKSAGCQLSQLTPVPDPIDPVEQELVSRNDYICVTAEAERHSAEFAQGSLLHTIT